MKINRELLKKYSELSDSELWAVIRGTAKQHGYSLPDRMPAHADMERIRSVMRGESEISMSAAMKILNTYKSKN